MAIIFVHIVDHSLLLALDFVATNTFPAALWLDIAYSLLDNSSRTYQSERTFVTFEPSISGWTVGPYI